MENPWLKYTRVILSTPLESDSDVNFQVKESTLETTFPTGKQTGIFSMTKIPKDTLLLEQFQEDKAPFNDPQVDLTEVLAAKTSQELYKALSRLRENYHLDIEKKTNVRLAIGSNRRMFYQATKEIPADTEFLRAYGLSAWAFEVLDLISRQTLAGYAQFVFDLRASPLKDPLIPRLIILMEVLQRYFLDEYLVLPWMVDLRRYDEEASSFSKEGNLREYISFLFRLTSSYDA